MSNKDGEGGELTARPTGTIQESESQVILGAGNVLEVAGLVAGVGAQPFGLSLCGVAAHVGGKTEEVVDAPAPRGVGFPVQQVSKRADVLISLGPSARHHQDIRESDEGLNDEVWVAVFLGEGVCQLMGFSLQNTPFGARE